MFTRGLNPKAAMGIGTVTWENLREGDVLRTKKYVELTSYEEIQPKIGPLVKGSTFKRDGYKCSKWIYTLRIPKDAKIKISLISKTLKKRILHINIIYTYIDYPSGVTEILYGPLEQFKKHFDIVQRAKL